jgi:hypothetical protein
MAACELLDTGGPSHQRILTQQGAELPTQGGKFSRLSYNGSLQLLDIVAGAQAIETERHFIFGRLILKNDGRLVGLVIGLEKTSQKRKRQTLIARALTIGIGIGIGTRAAPRSRRSKRASLADVLNENMRKAAPFQQLVQSLRRKGVEVCRRIGEAAALEASACPHHDNAVAVETTQMLLSGPDGIGDTLDHIQEYNGIDAGAGNSIHVTEKGFGSVQVAAGRTGNAAEPKRRYRGRERAGPSDHEDGSRRTHESLQAPENSQIELGTDGGIAAVN